MKRQKTKYPGVYYRDHDGERTFYIFYRLRQGDGTFKQVEEVAGRQHRDAMTPARASHIRTKRMHGEQLPNQERRAKAARKKKTWTISALWEEYLEFNPGHKNHASDSTLFNRYLAPRFADKQPADILVLDIDRLKRRELKDKSPQTQAHALELLRRLCNFGLKRGLCRGLTFTVQMPRLDNVKTEDLNPVQLRRLLEVIDHHVKYNSPQRQGATMMQLALYTGMRRGEMFKLTWDDIDWHRKNITLKDAKSGRDEIIPMSSYAERLLNEIQAAKSDSLYVFPGRGGGQLVDIKQQVNQIKAEAGLPADFRPLHGLRHVFASLLVSHDVSLDVVSRLLTHKGRSVTHRYAHFEDGILRRAAELAGRLVEEAAAENVIHLKA
ncbi:MAG: site-specific integrase [Actinomycetota bacterium]|jgi:integrase|nr:site-specific integrase [Actinomycetota bacterium]MCL6093541.1 site-specific integrase [Actinomycetota bacterium]MDA8166328.1 site-specific integrase [Actinomycetota bacterium]